MLSTYKNLCSKLRLLIMYGVIVLGLRLECKGESLRGVVYADSSGASGRGSGVVSLAIDGLVTNFFYTKPLPKFGKATCLEIGAIWHVETRGNELVTVKCDGQVEEFAHAPWLIVKEYLARLQKKSPTLDLSSARWKTSTEADFLKIN